MSYNIDTWRTKRLEDLRIPLLVLTNDSELSVLLRGDGVDVSGPSERFEIRGVIEGGQVVVEKIVSSGVGSGWAQDCVKGLLSHSTGQLEAVLVWEGGDSITRLIVDDGKVSEEKIEL